MITVRGTCRGDIEPPANDALELVLQWCRDRKLAIQPNKTEAVVFTRKTTPLHLLITAANVNAQISPSMKYLGVYFDSKLTWHAHLDFNTAKLHRLHGHLLQCLRATWGLGPDALRHLYIGAIEPALTYGCSSWGNVVTKQWARTKLLSIQRLFALRITRGFRTVSTEASLLLAGLIPIDLRIQERMAHYVMRRNAEPPECITADLQAAQINTHSLERKISYSQLPHPSQQIIISSPPDDITPSSRHISVYTDGSKGEGVSAAFTVSDNLSPSHYNNVSQLFRLDSSCTVYQAECLAIREALRWISTTAHSLDCVTIYSDCQSAIASF
jgi:hypothetical protein